MLEKDADACGSPVLLRRETNRNAEERLHGPHVWNFNEIYAALDEARGAEEVLDVNRLSTRIGAWLTDAAARKQVADSAAATVEQLGGALRRTLAAIEPYLMQLDLERR